MLTIAIVVLHWALPEVGGLLIDIVTKVLVLINHGVDVASAHVQ